MVVLEVRNIALVRGNGLAFAYDFRVAPGSILVVQGASGVGKTTLLDLIAGFEAAGSGEMLWRDVPFTALPPWHRPVTSVFQDDNLFQHMTCRQNVAIGVEGLAAGAPRIDDAFARLGIEGLGERLPHEISGGQQQRVVLARAMLRDKPVLLLDESFRSVDWETRVGCFDALVEMTSHRNMAVIMVSHEEREAEYLGCDVLRL